MLIIKLLNESCLKSWLTSCVFRHCSNDALDWNFNALEKLRLIKFELNFPTQWKGILSCFFLNYAICSGSFSAPLLQVTVISWAVASCFGSDSYIVWGFRIYAHFTVTTLPFSTVQYLPFCKTYKTNQIVSHVFLMSLFLRMFVYLFIYWVCF